MSPQALARTTLGFQCSSLRDVAPPAAEPEVREVRDVFTHEAPTPQRVLDFGIYRVHEKIADGALGPVHLGWRRGIDGDAGPVAIERVVPAFASSPETIVALARAASALRHVRLARVASLLELWVDEGQVNIVSEYVHGVSLSHLTAREAVPARIARAIVVDVFSALAELHGASRGSAIVHGDVTAANVRIGPDGVTRLTGAARRLTASASPADDVYAACAIAWDVFARDSREEGRSDDQVAKQVADVLSRGLAARSRRSGEAGRYDDDRWSAQEMADALRRIGDAATPEEVGAWVARVGERDLARRDAILTAAAQDAIAGGATAPVQRNLATGPWSEPRPRVATLIGVAPSGAPRVSGAFAPDAADGRPQADTMPAAHEIARPRSQLLHVMLVLTAFAAVFALAWTLAKLT